MNLKKLTLRLSVLTLIILALSATCSGKPKVSEEAVNKAQNVLKSFPLAWSHDFQAVAFLSADIFTQLQAGQVNNLKFMNLDGSREKISLSNIGIPEDLNPLSKSDPIIVLNEKDLIQVLNMIKGSWSLDWNSAKETLRPLRIRSDIPVFSGLKRLFTESLNAIAPKVISKPANFSKEILLESLSEACQKSLKLENSIPTFIANTQVKGFYILYALTPNPIRFVLTSKEKAKGKIVFTSEAADKLNELFAVDGFILTLKDPEGTKQLQNNFPELQKKGGSLTEKQKNKVKEILARIIIRS